MKKAQPTQQLNHHKGWVAALVLLLSSMTHAQEYQARGMIVALDQTILSSELAAKVVSIPKRMGESYVRGEILVQLDCDIFLAQQQKVAAEKLSAQTKLDNAKQLNQLRSIGTLEVVLAEAELSKVDAEYNIASINAERCQIKAPFDGQIEQVLVKEHEAVKQQQPLISLVGHKRLEADIVVPAQWITWLKIKQNIQLRLEENGQTLKAQLSHIGPAIDPTSQTLQLRAKLLPNQPPVYPGMSLLAVFEPQPK